MREGDRVIVWTGAGRRHGSLLRFAPPRPHERVRRADVRLTDGTILEGVTDRELQLEGRGDPCLTCETCARYGPGARAAPVAPRVCGSCGHLDCPEQRPNP